MDSTKNPTQPKSVNPVTWSWENLQHDNNDTVTLTTLDQDVLLQNLTSDYTGSYNGISNVVASGASVTSITAPTTLTTIGSSWMSTPPNGDGAKINLSGKNADIEVNGWSLVSAVKRIEERLGLFQPNPELESEWEDLRDLGEQYRRLEQHIKDKQATFDRIKAMPAPNID